MQHVTSFGGPRILLPTQDVERWIDEMGDEPTPDEGLYGLACSVDAYCGIIEPWDSPLLIFGDDPCDMFWSPHQEGGLFIRWIGADTLEQLTAFANSVADAGDWAERTEWDAQFGNYTLMDTCACPGDGQPRIEIALRAGEYVIESQYAESDDVMTIVQQLRFVR
ncbi:MAG: Imm21 family immunity protein [Planctomycetaceae bacterium]